MAQIHYLKKGQASKKTQKPPGQMWKRYFVISAATNLSMALIIIALLMAYKY